MPEHQIGFALHQMKRDPAYRDIIVAPPGYTMVEFDAAGQEFRLMAIASGDHTMLKLCEPGEDPHAFMGSRINPAFSYQEVMKQATPEAKAARQLGKVGNLCVAAGTVVLTDRGPCAIENVRYTDNIWDGLEFVSHAGVVCSGVRPVISYQGVTATPEHKVLVDGHWVRIEDAATYGRPIETALGQGWPRQCRAAVRIMEGIIRRAIHEGQSSLCARAMRLWSRTRCQPQIYGDWAIGAVQGVPCSAGTSSRSALHLRNRDRSTHPKTYRRMVSAVQQFEGSFVSQLWRARNRMSVYFGARSGRVGQGQSATPHVQETRYRQARQRWALRAWKLALGYAQAKPSQSPVQPVYDIVNCGPRSRFSANGRVVHNSLQYRTSATKLMTVARVQYGMPMELSEAQRIHFVYQRTYPGVPKYWNEQIALTKQRGWVETFAGRRVRVEGDWSGRFGWGMGSTAINYRIQGSGADQKYLAISVVAPYLIETGSRFSFELHDGIYLLVPDAKVEEFCMTAKKMLDHLPYQEFWGFTPPIPLTWDCKTGKSWGTMKEKKL